MSIVTLTIPHEGMFIKQGDTIPAITFTLLPTDDFDFSDSEIKMQLFQNGKLIFTAKTGEGITILEPKKFKIDQIEAAKNNFPHGILLGDIQFSKENGELEILYKGLELDCDGFPNIPDNILTGWSPKTNLRDGLTNIIKHYQSDNKYKN